MNTISEAVHEYVDLRRSLGYKLGNYSGKLSTARPARAI